MALRSLYKIEGTPLAEFVKQFGQMLIPTTMVYIDKLEINSNLEGVLLQPDFIPKKDRDAKRKEKQEELMLFYPKHGYEVIYKEEDTLPCYFLMGRLLKGEEGTESKDVGSDAEEEDSEMMDLD
ncbi:hypothetical protein LTR49_015706 [Elasticomyces elasticus]|nr:hypothetical protein LTR49_015706 [Elasticomyces elasticus]